MFRDRKEAGAMLAEQLQPFAGRNVVVLGLPRGGMPVAFEVASALRAPLDVFVVRKLGVPWQEELAMGAIASGGVRVLNESVVTRLGIPPATINEVTEREKQELERREVAYRDGRTPPEIRGKIVILVDDGLATGSTMRAAVAAVRQLGPARVVVAVPVGARDACAEFQALADEVVCLEEPEPFFAVGTWYDNFAQTTDDEVRELLARAAEK
ncbi:MAG: phosphoribosyltransferase [Planctomycetia bacterium]|nr:phosphoribosyltransferase [Planctomycetia bacterium]